MSYEYREFDIRGHLIGVDLNNEVSIVRSSTTLNWQRITLDCNSEGLIIPTDMNRVALAHGFAQATETIYDMPHNYPQIVRMAFQRRIAEFFYQFGDEGQDSDALFREFHLQVDWDFGPARPLKSRFVVEIVSAE